MATSIGAKSLLQTTVALPKGTHLASIIFLHGSGDTGDGIRGWIKMLLARDLEIKNTKIIFPTAPLRPYTPMNGAMSTVWYDRKKIAPTVPECADEIEDSCIEVGKIIKQEIDSGIPKNKIAIGGFSMGGGLAYHLAYHFHRDIAGVFALSSFVNQDSIVYEVLKENKGQLPPLFACHGRKDQLVLHHWGVDTVEKLEALGVEVEFHDFPRLYHELGVEELRLLEQWLHKVLMIE